MNEQMDDQLNEQTKEGRKEGRKAALTDKELSQVIGGVNVQIPLNKPCPQCKDGMLIFQAGLGSFCPICGHRQPLTQQNMRVQGSK